MKDRPFEVGFREQASNHPKRHRSKAVVVSVGEKAGDTGQVWITETSVSEPLMTCRKVPWRRRNQERVSLLGQGWEVPDDGPTGVRHEGGVTVILASIRNVRTCRSDVKGAGQAGNPCKSTKAEHRGGVARSRPSDHIADKSAMSGAFLSLTSRFCEKLPIKIQKLVY